MGALFRQPLCLDFMGFQPETAPVSLIAMTFLVVVSVLGVTPLHAASHETPGENGAARTLSLLQESLWWIRDRQQQPQSPDGGPEQAETGPSVEVPLRPSLPADAIPLSSAPAREDWFGQQFFLRGEDNAAEQADRVRVGFETERVPGFSNNLTVDGNWSISQQPGDTTMDVGLAWQVPWGRNRMTFRGRHHEYKNEVGSGDAVRQLGGTRQTLEIDLARSLYQGPVAGLDASVLTRDATNQWYENSDLVGEARRSYSLVRLNGHLGSDLPWLDGRGDLGLTVEGCVGLMDGPAQEACGERLGAFQRYNLTGDMERTWLALDWTLRGAYQFTPNELPSWRYMEVGPGMMHGFGGQVLRGRQGGWVRLDSVTPSRPFWLPSDLKTSLRLSVLRGWTEASGQPGLSRRASVGEMLWQVSGERMSAGVRAGTLLESSGPGMVSPALPDLSLDIYWTL